MSNRNTYRSQLAAYFAGQLSAEDAAALEHALAHDARLAREAEALRPVAEDLACEASKDSAEFKLSGDRIAVIRAAANKQIVAFPGAVRPRHLARRREVSMLRRVAPGLVAAAAVVIGAVAGFNSGRESYETPKVYWQVATEMPAADDADLVHYYPPAYGLDHHVYWPTRHRSNTEFAAATPVNYGLPGPTPGYLMFRGSAVVIQ